MKMYKKEDLKLIDGLLVAPDGTVVTVDCTIVKQANEMETMYQKALYLQAQPQAVSMPSLDGFERESVNKIETFKCETPIRDKTVEEALALIDELDDIQVTNEMNEMLVANNELVQFVKNDYVVGDSFATSRFDTPKLGNPLEWTEATICEAVARIHGCQMTDEGTDGESE